MKFINFSIALFFILLVSSCGDGKRTPPHSKMYAQVVIQVSKDNSLLGDIGYFLRVNKCIDQSLRKINPQIDGSEIEYLKTCLFKRENKNAGTVIFNFYDDAQNFALRFLDTLMNVMEDRIKFKTLQTMNAQLEKVNRNYAQLKFDCQELEKQLGPLHEFYQIGLLEIEKKAYKKKQPVKILSDEEKKRYQKLYDVYMQKQKSIIRCVETRTEMEIEIAGYKPTFIILQKPKIVVRAKQAQ